MEPRFLRQANGQEVSNLVLTGAFDEAALADDRVLWELLRLLPGSSTPQKGILPYAVNGAGFGNSALVQPGTPGNIRVMPFRAIVGSVTDVNADALEYMRGIRSGYSFDPSSFYKTIALGPNPPGNARWTLIYATISPEVEGITRQQMVKDPESGVMTRGPLLLSKVTTVSLSSVDGTPSPNPVRPALPADSGGAYNIPLAYVLLPVGFTLTSAIDPLNIHEVAPCLSISPALGGPSMRPANGQWKPTGPVVTRQGWTPGARPGAYLPPTMTGGTVLWIQMQLGLAPVSHQSGDVIDDSEDWRDRMFQWHAYIAAGDTAANAFSSDRSGDDDSPNRSPGWPGGHGVSNGYGMGQSFHGDFGTPTPLIPNSRGIAAAIAGQTPPADPINGGITNLGGTTVFAFIYVDATTGALKLWTNGGPSGQVFVRLEASPRFSGH